ncbi:MAG: TIGR03000 domain-containing protein [Planctomycetota bacterium]|nr:MAG: TIGR03000 domain-containing protein [Planctomycetota bacterium]
MWRTALKVLVAAALSGMIAQDAEAFGHRRWGWGCGWGCGYPGYVGCGYGGWGYGGWGYRFPVYAGWGYGYPAYGWGYYGRAVRVYPPLVSTNTSAARSQLLAARANRDSVRLNVSVPDDATVFINDRPTTSTGGQREYVSHDLRSDSRYAFRVRAEFERDGQPVVEEKTVTLTAGQTASLDLRAAAPVQTAAPAKTATTLVVHLPQDAKLYLAGRATSGGGEVREFTTTQLAPGEQWASYTVRAVVNRDGHEEVRQQRVTLEAGETQTVSLDFDAPQVADAR